MPPELHAPLEPQLADLDAAGTIELCRSLADYAEAGGLSHELMLRVGRYAEGRYAHELDVLLAVARLYQIGGELARSRAALIRAGRRAPRDARVLRPLQEVLRALGDQGSPADAIAAAGSEPASSRPEPAPRAAASRRLSEAPRGPMESVRPSRTSMESVRPSRTSMESVRPSRSSMESVRPSRSSMESVRQPRGARIKLLELDDPRRRLDPYELIGELAAGGMASVFLGRLTGAGGFQRLVAIKRLHPHLARAPEFVEMFLDEARIAAGIHNPHVVPILEMGQSDAGYYLVMEFIEGDTLATLTSRAHARGVMLPRGVAARILIDALHGLHAAHQLKDADGRLLGVIHRDCTPQNILVGVDGCARLTDFGVARAAARYAITRSQVIKGKIAYLSPEQAIASDLDRRSDLFSMGIVLWEVLAGRPLFLGDNDAVTISRVLAQPVPSLRKLSPDVAPALDEVCGRALARDPAKRFPTAAAMAEAIERAARSSPGGVASPGEVGRCVEDLLGAELTAQRDAVRAWIAQQESASQSRAGRAPAERAASVQPQSALDLGAPVFPRPPAIPRGIGIDAAAPADASSAARKPSARDAPFAPPRAELEAHAAPSAWHTPRRWLLLAALLVAALASATLWLNELP